jgi:hypothetical protein
MFALALDRRTTAPALAIALAVFLAACAGSSPPQASDAPKSSDSPPVASPPSTDPGPAIDTDALVAAAAAKDGQTVRVTGFFLAADGQAWLCSVVLESYPPQCGGGIVRLTGEVPADVMAALDSTTEPGLAQATWGWVVVNGTFHASGADGSPTVDIGEISTAAP